MNKLYWIILLFTNTHQYEFLSSRRNPKINKIVDKYRKRYGQRRCWWGDYNAKQTRRLYHILLPKKKSKFEIEKINEDILKQNDRKKMWDESEMSKSISQRYAAKIYSRERSQVPIFIYAFLFDLVRRNDIKTESDIYYKYAKELGISYDFDDLNSIPDEKYKQLCMIIIEKSRVTNTNIDQYFALKKVRNTSDVVKQNIDFINMLKCLYINI